VIEVGRHDRRVGQLVPCDEGAGPGERAARLGYAGLFLRQHFPRRQVPKSPALLPRAERSDGPVGPRARARRWRGAFGGSHEGGEPRRQLLVGPTVPEPPLWSARCHQSPSALKVGERADASTSSARPRRRREVSTCKYPMTPSPKVKATEVTKSAQVAVCMASPIIRNPRYRGCVLERARLRM